MIENIVITAAVSYIQDQMIAIMEKEEKNKRAKKEKW